MTSGGMFHYDEAMTDLVVAYCKERLALNPVPLDFGGQVEALDSVLAGLIETIDDGGAAGRVTVRVERPLAAAEARAAFAARGIHATQGHIAEADEVEPEESHGELVRSAA